MSFWKYRGRCTGRIIHFLYHYAGLQVAETAIIGPDFVEYRGKTFATYTWLDEIGRCDVPNFTFLDDEDFVRRYVQTNKKQEAISDGCALEVPQEGRISVPPEALYVLILKGYRAVNLYCEGMHGTTPTFFIHRSRLFAEANGWIYAWMPDANNWTVWVEGKK